MSNPRNPYFASAGPGPGMAEDKLQRASGLRTISFSGILANDPTLFVDGFTPANQTEWTEIPLKTRGAGTAVAYTRPPFPCSICIRYKQEVDPAPGGQKPQFRVTGYDLFGQRLQQIVKPNVNETLLGTAILTPGSGWLDTYMWTGRAFSVVEKLEYKLSGFDAADEIDVGVVFMMNGLLDSVLTDAGIYNLGPTKSYRFEGAGVASIGIPLQLYPASIYNPVSSTWVPPVIDAVQKTLPGFEMTSLQLENITDGKYANVQPAGHVLEGPGGFRIGSLDANGKGEPNGFTLQWTDTAVGNTQILDVAGADFGTPNEGMTVPPIPLEGWDAMRFHATVRTSMARGIRAKADTYTQLF